MIDDLGTLGPFISGVALLVAAIAAWFTFYFLHLKGRRDTWIENYQSLYKEFWDAPGNAIVREQISNDAEYKTLAPILVRRNKSPNNSLSSEESEALDRLDRFLSIFARLRFWRKVGMSKYQKELYRISFTHYWAEKINSREELKEYIDRYWPKVTNLD